MTKDIFGNEITHNVFGKKISSNKRQPISKNQRNFVKITQKGRCKDCRKILVVEDFHHIKHVAKNGKSTTNNLVALCPECHKKRHIKEAAMKTDRKRKQNKNPSFPKVRVPKFPF